jgi:hypothetical protein
MVSLNAQSPTNSTFARLLDAIEALRRARLAQFQRKHPGGKRFTQQELTERVCPTYKNYLDGRSQRLPTRETLLAIAAYLECTPAERNGLLRLAGYLPEAAQPAPGALEAALTRGRKLMSDLRFPSLLVTRDYRLHAICPNFRALLGTPALADIPEARRTLFHLTLDPALTPRLCADSREGLGRALLAHHQARGESPAPWLRELLADPARRAWWRGSTLVAPPETPEGAADFGGARVAFNLIFAPVDADKTATLITLLPLDERARIVFEAVGCVPPSAGDLAGDDCRGWQAAYTALRAGNSA